jgi:hypothetical protein
VIALYWWRYVRSADQQAVRDGRDGRINGRGCWVCSHALPHPADRTRRDHRAEGERVLFLAGLVVGGLAWWITAFRLARPSSWWARRFYGAAKLQRAQDRYGSTQPRKSERRDEA